MIQERKNKNSSKINLVFSAIFHALLIAVVIFFAAREGILGKKLKELTVVMVPKEKNPEPPKENPEEPKVVPPKAPEPPKVAAVQPKVQTAVAPPPSAQNNAPAVAPPAAVLSGLEFSDGAKEVQTISDPKEIYKALVEHALLSRWNRSENIDDVNFAAEVEVTLDQVGAVKGYRWLTGSGDRHWDDSVRQALAQTKSISRPPPKGFPPVFVVRFDVESARSEAVQLSSR